MTPEPRAYLLAKGADELVVLVIDDVGGLSARTVTGQPPAALAERLISYEPWPRWDCKGQA